MKSLLVMLLVVALIRPAVARAQSLQGDWNAAMNTPGGTINFRITFQLRGDTVTGTVHRSAGDVPLRGTIKGDTVSFGYIVQYNGHDLSLTMTAKLVGDSLRGTVDFDGQGDDQFWAVRVRHTPGAPAALQGRVAVVRRDATAECRHPTFASRCAGPAAARHV